jgi:hypothetical protein
MPFEVLGWVHDRPLTANVETAKEKIGCRSKARGSEISSCIFE